MKLLSKGLFPLLLTLSALVPVSLQCGAHAAADFPLKIEEGTSLSQLASSGTQYLSKLPLAVASEGTADDFNWGDDEDVGAAIAGGLLILLPLCWRPSRKAIGLLNIIVGSMLTLTGVGGLVGIPMILVGGILFFI